MWLFSQLLFCNNEYLEWIPVRCCSAKQDSFRNFVLTKRSSRLKEVSSSLYFGKIFRVKWFHNEFHCKENHSVHVFCPESTFSRNSINFVFSFRLYSSNGKGKIYGVFFIFGDFQRLLSNLNIWCTYAILNEHMRYLKNIYHTVLFSSEQAAWFLPLIFTVDCRLYNQSYCNSIILGINVGA